MPAARAVDGVASVGRAQPRLASPAAAGEHGWWWWWLAGSLPVGLAASPRWGIGRSRRGQSNPGLTEPVGTGPV